MHFSWDNRGRTDIIGSSSSDVSERRTSTGSAPFSIFNCLDATKFVLLRVFTLIETICAKKCLKSRLKAQECKSLSPVDVRHSKTSQPKLPHNRMDGRTDGRMGRLIPNFFKVVQILLEIAVVVSLRDYWRFPKEVDYSLHHTEHCL